MSIHISLVLFIYICVCIHIGLNIYLHICLHSHILLVLLFWLINASSNINLFFGRRGVSEIILFK